MDRIKRPPSVWITQAILLLFLILFLYGGLSPIVRCLPSSTSKVVNFWSRRRNTIKRRTRHLLNMGNSAKLSESYKFKQTYAMPQSIVYSINIVGSVTCAFILQ